MTSQKIRVRFAPSPTGPLHIGGLRTALFNYFFAKKQGGDFILRIEDTDRMRYVEGAEAYIQEALAWCGIVPDEGPQAGGKCGPYRQSARKEIYQKYVQQLLDAGKAYYAFDTPAELDAMRARLKAAKVANQQYNAITRTEMNNALTLSEEDVSSRINNGEPYVVRLKIPIKEEIRINDLVRGWVKTPSFALEDKIILKSDGMPTYHLANVVDDRLMGITHVIRGEEWLPSAPLHMLLYRFLGWEDQAPRFAHLPLLLKPSGKGKLSKRDGDKLGFAVFPLAWKDPKTGQESRGFREDGFLPEAFVNFLALLGWNPARAQEIFSIDALIEAFSLDKVNKAGAKFDLEKAHWFNQQYLRNKSEAEIGTMLLNILDKENIACSSEKARQVAMQMKDRVTFPSELWTEGKYFFIAPTEFNEKIVRKRWKEPVKKIVTEFGEKVSENNALTARAAKQILTEICEKAQVKIGQLMPALRLVLTGQGGGPDLMVLMEILGSKEVAKRIDYAAKHI